MENKDLSNERVYSDYHIAIYYNGEVRKLSFSKKPLPESQIKYLVHCQFIRHGNFSHYSTYYRYILYDNQHNRIENNTIQWDGYKCNIHPEDTWGDIKKVNIQFKADVWDKLGIKETLTIENRDHSEYAFQELLTYLQDLTHLQTHSALKFAKGVVKKMQNTIDELNKRIQDLEK